ncbi:LOW QUALITY PROTEIN: Fc receptor-like protein 3 [Dromiciops gliroides]|uniref:LOW QUALITY PROTEIN: Fc receptor-like protein 3 n=1 Tax=Dromiciops gliroides TaxID=33562 RepID=UPI001CC418BE|nr:LOW QUALITY PROTEIN: Fc receptor-like protein 3 [Dromiciops gliroides]
MCTFLFQGPKLDLFATERTFPSQSPMEFFLILLWVSLLVIAPVCGQSAPLKPVIFLEPRWTTHFKGESVRLKCNGFHSYVTGKTQWYFNMELLEATFNDIRVENSGHYACRTQDSPLSNPVFLSFSNDELILQTSYPVFEGDSLVLKCVEKKKTKLTQVTYYKNGEILASFNEYSEMFLSKINKSNSGQYHCSAKKKSIWKFLIGPEEAKPVTIQVQELFSTPILRSTTLEPSEGTPVTLSCETQLPPEKTDTQLYFSFFRNNRIISSSQERSPKLQLIKVWKDDSGSYHCEAKTVTSRVQKKSQPIQIKVKRIPVSGIHLEIYPPGGQVAEGQTLVLVCSVAGGTGDITFSWSKQGTGAILKKKTQRLLVAEFKILAMRESEAGEYYCTANNTNNLLHSKPVSISVKIPVSPPLLTFSIPETQMFVGKVVELKCKVQRGSAPILYRFYHEGKIMKNSSAPLGDTASFNLSLTEQHAGNYICEADNGIAAQFSKTLTLSVRVPVSRPHLTISVLKPHATGGDMVEFRCEAETGTTPILYRFFRQGTILGSGWAHLGEAAFLNLSLPSGDSGIYSCEADNGFIPQLSEGVNLSVSVLTGKQRGRLAGEVSLGLLGFLGLISVGLLLYFKTQRRSGESFAFGLSRSPAIPESQEPTQVELEPTYVNDPGQQSETHSQVFADPGLPVIYSEFRWLQQKEEDADGFTSMLPPTQDFSVVYTEVKAEQPLEETVGVTEATDGTQEDDTGNYENVQLHS